MNSRFYKPVTFAGVLSVIVCLRATTVQAGAVPERNEISDEYKWDLSQMYKTTDDWQAHYQQLEKEIQAFAKLEGSTGKSAEDLARVLKRRDELEVQLEKLSAYAAMRYHEDMRVNETKALDQRATTVVSQYREASAWLEPELVKLPPETVKSWLKQDDLAVYEHYFDNLWRLQAHVLSKREEELLAMSGKAINASYETFSTLTNAELKLNTMKDREGNDTEISSGVFYKMLYSKDRQERQDAYLGYMDSYLEIKNTLASTLAGSAERDWFNAKARGYNSALEAALDRENLPLSVYRNLISTVNKNLPLLHRYAKMKKQCLGLKELHPYDLYVNLVDIQEQTYTYDEAKELVLEGIAPLGEDYLAIMKLAFDSGWIDVYENKGKRSGAYNMGTYLSPPFVLLNFNGTFNDVSTVAHELGHAMQSHFAQKNQPPVYSGYPMFTAEVASTAAEIVFKRHMLERMTDPKQKAWLIEAMLDNIRNTVFRQTKFAEFDLAFHEMAERGEPITADVLMKTSRDIFQKYYGPELVLDTQADVECLRIPHYYYNYYVYRYATSYSAATALAKRFLDKEPGAVEDFMEFLKLGNSMYAIDMLKVAGVDMTTPKPVEDCMKQFETLLDELEALLKEIG